MAAEHLQVPLGNGENKEDSNENENEKEKKEKLVVEESGEKKEENLPQQRPRNQSQSWPRPQNRPFPQHVQNSQPFQQDFSNQGEFNDRRKSVTFGPALRKDIPPENRPPTQQFRRPSPWAVLRAKLPTGENLPALRPGITNEHFIQRMQNPEAASRPPNPNRPPLSRPGSQESVRPPYIQRSDSVTGRPPSSPRPSPSPMRPASRTSMSSKDEEDEVNPSEMRIGQSLSQSRPSSGQRGMGPPYQAPMVAQSPIIQIASNPPNMQPSPQVMNQPPRIQQSSIPPNTQSQVQNSSLIQNQSSPPLTHGPPMVQTNPQNMTPPKPQVPNPAGQQSQVQGQVPSNATVQQSQGPSQQGGITSQSQQNQPQNQVLNQTPLSQNQPQTSINNRPTPSGPVPSSTVSVKPSPQQNHPTSVPATPPPASPAQPGSAQNSVPPSPIGPRRPISARSTDQMQSPPPSRSQPPQKQEISGANKEENKIQGAESVSETNLPEEKPKQSQYDNKQNLSGTIEEKIEKDIHKNINGLPEKSQHQPPIIVDAMLKRPLDLKGPPPTGKAEEINKTTKENEPPKNESPKKESTPSKAQEPAVLNGNHDSPKKSKAGPPKKLGTAQSPLKSPSKPMVKTPETPGTAEKKKLPMNKVQVGAAPSPNLKSVKSKIGSLENANHKPGGGHVKIEHRKLNFNAGPKIEAKNDTYTPGGGDKKIQQVKLQWNAKPKVGSLENATHKPGGGDKKIESVKLDFKEKAKPKVGSKDNMKHVAGGGTVKNSDENLAGSQCDIEDQKLEIKAQSKIGSLDNVKHKPGGGEKKIFDDKEYLKQMASTSSDSLNQERKKRSRCNSTSSQESRYKSEDRASSRLSLKSEGQKDQPKDKSPQRPTDQNSNQVNEKIMSEDHLKNPKYGQGNEKGSDKVQAKPEERNYLNLKTDANGNGKAHDINNSDVENSGIKQRVQNSEIQGTQSPISKTVDKQPSLTAILTPEDKKSGVSQPNNPPTNQQGKELSSSIHSKDTINNPQIRPSIPPNMPRPQISSSNSNGKTSSSKLPPNIRLARDLINERDGIIEKCQTEKTEKEIHLPQNTTGQLPSK